MGDESNVMGMAKKRPSGHIHPMIRCNHMNLSAFHAPKPVLSEWGNCSKEEWQTSSISNSKATKDSGLLPESQNMCQVSCIQEIMYQAQIPELITLLKN